MGSETKVVMKLVSPSEGFIRREVHFGSHSKTLLLTMQGGGWSTPAGAIFVEGLEASTNCVGGIDKFHSGREFVERT